MKKRIFSILLVLCMMMSLLPAMSVGALATEPEHANHNGWTELKAESYNGGSLGTGSYYLSADLTLSSQMSIESGTNVTLCLNGHTLSGSDYDEPITVSSGGTLTICDCGTDGTVTGGSNYGIYNSGTLNIEGGTVTSSSRNGIYNYGTLKISGGKVSTESRYDHAVNSVGLSSKLYLSGSSVITAPDVDYALINIGSGSLYASDGATENPDFYSGTALTISFNPYTLGKVAVYGVSEENKGLFTLKNTNYELKNGTDTNVNNLVIHGKTKALTWQNSAGETLSGEGYLTEAEYGTTLTLPDVPAQEYFIGVGWCYSTDGGTTWSGSSWSASTKVAGNTKFKPIYVPVFAGGGTSGDPYLIDTVAQLQGLATLVNSGITAYNSSSVYYKLSADTLDLSTVCGASVGEGGTSWTPIGSSYSSSSFKAKFNGNGKTISNLYINALGNDYQGLFGYVGSGGSVTNLSLTGVNVTGNRYVGAVVGYLYGTVTGCTVTGEVYGKDYMGTVVGYNSGGTAENNTATGCTVTPAGYTGNGIMAYKIEDADTFDVKGFYNGAWIKTEFGDSYELKCTGVSVNDNVKTTVTFVNEGRFVQLNYTVTAGSSGISGGKLAVYADTQIGKNDKAAVEVIRDGDKVIGLKMADDYSDNSSYGAQFNLYFKGVGLTDVDTYWFGAHSGENSHCGDQLTASTQEPDNGSYKNDGELYTGFSGDDSGIAFSWNIDLAANQSKTYSVILGVGETSAVPEFITGGVGASPISLTKDAQQKDLSVLVGAQVAHVDGQTSSLYYSIDGATGKKLGDFTQDSTDTTKDVISHSLDISSLETGDHTLDFWVMNSKGARSAAVSKAITLADGEITEGLDSSTVPEAKWGTSASSLTSSGTLVNAVAAANGASGTTYIQLQKDVTASAALEFASGKITVLDLNGCTIDRGLKGGTATLDGYVIKVNGTLTVKDSSNSSTGKITGGNSTNNCGGVYVLGQNATFIMEGGCITGNSANNGGGVFVSSTAAFTMKGGSITGNNANAGGGVFVDGSFNVSSAASVIDNVKNGTLNGGVYTGNTKNNVYLTLKKTITVTGELAEGASFGVTSAKAPSAGVPIAIALGKTTDTTYDITAEDAKKFTSDSDVYSTLYSGGNHKVELKVKTENPTYELRWLKSSSLYLNASGFSDSSIPNVTCPVGEDYSFTITADGNHSLPRTISIHHASQGTALEAGRDYTYNTTTGVVTIKGTSAKVIEGSSWNVSAVGSITTAAQLQTALGGSSVASVDGNKVTLLASRTIETEEQLNIESADLILDLAGHSVTAGNENTYIGLLPSGKLTITDSATGSIGCMIGVSGGELNINGGNFNGGLVTVGGKDMSILSISGGSFARYTNVEIIDGEKQTLFDGIAAGAKVYSYVGGEKGAEITGDALKVQEYTKAFLVEAGVYTAIESPISQKMIDDVLGKDKASFESPSTIKLLADLTLTSPLSMKTDVTLDLNGRTITGAAGKDAITVTSGAGLTVTDSSTGEKGSVTGGAGGCGIKNTGSGAVTVGSGVTVKGGQGADGIKTNGDVIVKENSIVLGGNGAAGSTGGYGINAEGTVTVGAGCTVTGGNGGDAAAAGNGGNGGDAAAAGNGGNGGVGISSANAVIINGAVTGGNGGDGGTASGNGGAGGAGVNTEIGENVGGRGTVTGGNGGNIPATNSTGTVGAAGIAVTGGDADNTLTIKAGKSGIKVSIDTTGIPSGVTVTVPENELIDAALTANEQNGGGSIGIKLTVKASDNNAGKAAVDDAKTPGATVGLYLEVTLEKTIGGTAETITKAQKLIPITIALPTAMQGWDYYAVLRQHDGKVDTLTDARNADGEYISVNVEQTIITVYAKKFSTYAVAYSASPITPVQPSNPGSGGGSGSSSAPTPQVNSPANGTVTLSPKSPTVGSTVTVTATPDEGYVVDTVTAVTSGGTAVTVIDAGNGNYTFKQSSQKVTVTVTFRAKTELPFGDVRLSDWFYDDVRYVYENGLMQGVGDTTFAPHTNTTRGMIVTILWRLEKLPEATTAMTFTDVADGKYYYDAVEWAAENKIVAGYDALTFGPDNPITREQMATILYRYAAFKGYDMTATADLSKFADADKIGTWATTALSWANANGLITGKGNGILDPQGKAERCQVAAILHRFCENVAK